MAGMPHWKTTVAMTAFYAAAAVLLYLAIQDHSTVVVALLVLFALVLLAGNMYVRAKEKAHGARHKAQGDNGALHPAPGTQHPDPEMGRR